MKTCTIYIDTLPPPPSIILKDQTCNLAGSSMLGRILKIVDIVIYKSNVYPGCTVKNCVPVLEITSGLTYNTDFFCGYSPERLNPGDKVNILTKIKKVTCSSISVIASEIEELYASIITA